jgi:ribonuclease BN (tRNA processing enzyme)
MKMQIRVVDGCPSPPHHRQATLISYVVGEKVAFDAGALALLPLDEQRQLKAIFLSHSHADHTATLPLLIDHIYQPGPECISLYANSTTIDDLRQHVFNGRVWPDVFELAQAHGPFIELKPVQHGQTVHVDEFRVTAFDVNHTIPTLGFVIEDEQSAIAIVADTARCDAIWEFLAEVEKLRAVFLEISFPNSMQWLADVAKHLTTNDFMLETRKLRKNVAWLITHMKLEHASQIEQEVAQLQIDNCQFAMGGVSYRF